MACKASYYVKHGHCEHTRDVKHGLSMQCFDALCTLCVYRCTNRHPKEARFAMPCEMVDPIEGCPRARDDSVFQCGKPEGAHQ